jgi:hemerythrin-like domain-containing protein
MKATEILSSEHRIIERTLAIMETSAWFFDQVENANPDLFLRAADFISGYADGCHHRKEEDVLFKVMVDHGMSQECSPVAAMLFEHEQGRKFTRLMRSAAEEVKNGNIAAYPEVIHNARLYAALLRHHIQMEDRVVFSLADEIIPLQEQDSIWESFQRIEDELTREGMPAKCLALVDVFENELESIAKKIG